MSKKLKGEPIKYMDVKEFHAEGYLQELNRKFLHPLGLALEIILDEDGTETLGGIWDYRDDPEGIGFAKGMIDIDKIIHIARLRESKREVRYKRFGDIEQGINT